jgi:hypothetical protein
LLSSDTIPPSPDAAIRSERLQVSHQTRPRIHSNRQTLHAQISQVQRSCVDTLADLLASSPSLEEPRDLSAEDSKLAVALTELLEVTYDLESSNTVPLPSDEGNLESAFQALAGNLEDLQSSSRQRDAGANGNGDAGQLHPSVYAVREELAWARLESLSTAVVALVKERKEAQETSVPGFGEASGSAPLADDVPPRYSFEQRRSISEAGLPTYAPGQQHDESPTEEKAKSSVHTPVSASTPTSAPREKMLLELDGLADAIGRLHSVTPRLNDQRVEFRASSSKSATMPADLRARAEREKVRELELIWDQIERTHGKRRMKDVQRVDMAGWEERRAKQVSSG